MYDRTNVQGVTFNMRGQLYRRHVNATALSSGPVVSALWSVHCGQCTVVSALWSVHWAPSRTTRVLVLAGAKRCALETCGKENGSSG